MKKNNKWFILAIMVTVGIFFFSTFLVSPIKVKGVNYIDKWGHLVSYFILAGSFFIAYKKIDKFTKNTSYIILVSACVYGFLLEWIQYSFFEYRYFEWMDVLANITGVIFCFLFFSFFNYKKSSKEKG